MPNSLLSVKPSYLEKIHKECKQNSRENRFETVLLFQDYLIKNISENSWLAVQHNLSLMAMNVFLKNAITKGSQLLSF